MYGSAGSFGLHDSKHCIYGNIAVGAAVLVYSILLKFVGLLYNLIDFVVFCDFCQSSRSCPISANHLGLWHMVNDIVCWMNERDQCMMKNIRETICFRASSAIVLWSLILVAAFYLVAPSSLWRQIDNAVAEKLYAETTVKGVGFCFLHWSWKWWTSFYIIGHFIVKYKKITST